MSYPLNIQVNEYQKTNSEFHEYLTNTKSSNNSRNFGFLTILFDLSDPVVSVEQDVEIDGKDIITSFAWHPIEENCLVASRKDGRLAEVHVMERIAPR